MATDYRILTVLHVPCSLDSGLLALPSEAGLLALQGYLTHKKQPPPLGPDYREGGAEGEEVARD